MRRLVAVIIAALALVPAASRAAEVTRIATAAEADIPFQLDLSIRWERTQKSAVITREKAGAATATHPFGTVQDVPELALTEITNVVTPRLAAGIFQDLELHMELPYYLGHETSWKYASGITVQGDSSISSNTIGPDGLPCSPSPCPLFEAGPQDTTVFQGGVAGDFKVGVAWGAFSDTKDNTKPFWLLGADLTFPTATRFDPWAGRKPTLYTSPYSTSSHVGPVGEKAWKYDLYTALSKRMGVIEPYFKFHVAGMHKSSSTYSNCEHASDATDPPPSAMTPSNCTLAQWGTKADAKLPWTGGLMFGTEFIPLDDTVSGQKVVIDVRLTSDYISGGRWYNELTDATGKLLWTDPYVTFGAELNFLFRASKYVAVKGSGGWHFESAHLLTGEKLGVADGTNTSPDQNPNFDWRWDAPGRRFRITHASVYTMQLAGILNF
jgi:hypothetical protein